MRKFNLIDEKWIPVRFLDGKHDELGISDTLLRSREIAAIEDQSPLVVAALHRHSPATATGRRIRPRSSLGRTSPRNSPNDRRMARPYGVAPFVCQGVHGAPFFADIYGIPEMWAKNGAKFTGCLATDDPSAPRHTQLRWSPQPPIPQWRRTAPASTPATSAATPRRAGRTTRRERAQCVRRR